MSDSHLVAALYSDFTGLTRVRTFPARDLAKRIETGLGWVPANMCLTPFGPIAAPNPFGPLGDLRLVPDPESEVRVPLGDGVSDFHAFLSDLREVDGTPWDCCVRGFLKRTLEELEDKFRLRVRAAFEHEFVLQGYESTGVPAGFTLASARACEGFLAGVSKNLIAARIDPEMIIPEYGAQQFEVTCQPKPALLAADEAVLVRELVRETARIEGMRATFSPKPALGGPGNGLHVHFSLETADGKPVTTVGEDDPPRVDERTGSFVAGIVGALPEMTAVLAPAAVSYLRLKPQQWSAAFTSFGYRNRETALRLCPSSALQEAEGQASANVELRVPDGAASPHLAMALLVRSGMDGLRRQLAAPALIDKDPSALSEEERRRAGLADLPHDLAEALGRLEGEASDERLMPRRMAEAYLALKRAELAMVQDCSDEELCQRYVDVY